MTNTVIGFAVVGLGHIGKRHADMITEHESCELVAVIDTDETLRNIVDKEYNVPFFTSLDEFLKSGVEVDVINIATPNAIHAEQSIACLQAGTHVVIEKPIALSTKDCQSILDTAKANNKQVFCVMQNRYSAPMQWLKQLLADNVLGKIFMVDVHCYWNRDERYYTGDTWHGTDIDGGTLFTQFSHYIDLLYWLFGDVRNIQARFANYSHESMIDFEDTGTVQFDFASGGHGSLSYSTAVWDKNMESTLVIVGENGTVKIGGQYMDRIEYCHINNYELKEDIVTKTISIGKYAGAKANHYFVIQNVVNVLLGNVTNITTKAEEGTKVVEIIERIYALK